MRRDAVFWIHAILLGAAGLFWLCFLGEFVGGNVFSDYGAGFLLVALFSAIPIGMTIGWWIGRKRPPAAGRKRTFYFASKVLLGMTWAPTWLPLLFVLAVFEPWPISLRQGPDTEFAREGFARHFGHALRDGGYELHDALPVEDVYYRIEGPRDATFYVRFDCADREVLDCIVAGLDFEPIDADPKAFGGPSEGGPDWWPRSEAVRVDEAYVRERDWQYLWYDARAGRVWYKQLTF